MSQRVGHFSGRDRGSLSFCLRWSICMLNALIHGRRSSMHACLTARIYVIITIGGGRVLTRKKSWLGEQLRMGKKSSLQSTNDEIKASFSLPTNLQTHFLSFFLLHRAFLRKSLLSDSSLGTQGFSAKVSGSVIISVVWCVCSCVYHCVPIV